VSAKDARSQPREGDGTSLLPSVPLAAGAQKTDAGTADSLLERVRVGRGVVCRRPHSRLSFSARSKPNKPARRGRMRGRGVAHPDAAPGSCAPPSRGAEGRRSGPANDCATGRLRLRDSKAEFVASNDGPVGPWTAAGRCCRLAGTGSVRSGRLARVWRGRRSHDSPVCGTGRIFFARPHAFC
jgi:hypothetical protein